MRIRKFMTAAACVAAGHAAIAFTDPLIVYEQVGLIPDGTDFGFSSAVAVAGETVFVGHPGSRDELGTPTGSVYVYRREGAAWILETQLHANDSMQFDQFGWSVSASGGRLLVGAPQHDEAGSLSGVAYVFRREGTSWIQEATLVPSDLEAGDRLGGSVALFADVALVGAVASTDAGTNTGSAYVFRRSGTTWTQEAKLLAADAAAGDEFGSSAAIHGDAAVVGAMRADAVGPDSGAAYVFRFDGVAWAQELALVPQDLASGDFFGTSVSIHESILLVGAPYADGTSGLDSGAVYVFRKPEGAAWAQQARLVSPDDVQWTGFGNSVSLSGNLAMIGHPNLDFVVQGSALLFQRGGSNSWTLAARIPPQGSLSLPSALGHQVALDGTTLVAGARFENFIGAAHIYSAEPCCMTYCVGKPSSLGCTPSLDVEGLPSETDGPFRVVASDLLPGQPGILLYGYGEGHLDFHGARLCVKAPLRRYAPRISKALGPPPCAGIQERDFNQLIQSGADPMLTQGRRVFAQWHGRDPADPTGFGDSLSDAVTFVIGL
jgi:hypothetical protein